MYIYLKNVDIACISTGEVYGKIEDNGVRRNVKRANERRRVTEKPMELITWGEKRIVMY